MVKRKNRLMTDALREVRRTKNRFLSLFILSALAVAFLSGLRTTSPDMKYTADLYFDAQRLMDVRVLSNLGMTQEDLQALAALEGVAAAEGSHSFDVVCGDRILNVLSTPEQINLLSLREGRLPGSFDECVVEQSFLSAAGLSLGDQVTLDLAASNHEGDLVTERFTIVGVADSPMYISVDRGSSTLGTGRVSAFLVVPAEAFAVDYYTTVYLDLAGTEALDCYSDEYDDMVDAFIDGIEDFAAQRAALRFEDVRADAQAELDEARAEYDDARAEVDQELADAERELADARAELDDGWAQLEEGRADLRRETAQAEADLQDAYSQLQDAMGQYNDGREQYDAAVEELANSRAALEESQNTLALQQAALDGIRISLEAGLAQYEELLSAFPEGSPEYAALAAELAEQKAELDASLAQLNASQAELDAARAQLNAGLSQLENGERQLEQTRVQLEDAWEQILQGRRDYDAGVAELDRAIAEAEQELAEAEQELNDGEREYADGLAEYEEGRAEAEEELADAEKKLADAQEEIDSLDAGEWYVLSRSTLAGYVTYGSDSERMSNLANVFPLIFFLVAALACLTTMTRMVEEQRTQIGCMKALGFTRRAISVKYIGYAFFASFAGGAVGAVLGCILIPLVIYNAWSIMYTLPNLSLLFQPGICALAVLAAVACTTGASLAACLSTLTATPAGLMRPRAPKAGKRVLLERIRPIWSRLGFIQKVTVRNLFRYKRRFWMTVIGIGGCTALIVTGFGIHNSIFDILEKQYGEVTPYNASVGLKDGITEEELEEITGYLNSCASVKSYLTSYQSTVDVTGEDSVVEGVNLFAVDDLDAFGEYIHLRHRVGGGAVALPEEGIVITEKLSELLEVGVGDTITIDGDRRVTVPVGDIVENYVYHYIYLTEDYYETLFGAHPTHNTLMLNYTDDSDEISDQVSTGLIRLDGVSAYTHIAYIRDTFTDSMASIDYAVVIIILSAAALAFVVLYNLTNINITERMRELATLKVLGFYDREVSAYVYRENMFLTVFGIAIGLVMGRFLHAWLIRTVEINMVMFGRTAAPSSYVLAAVLTVVFSIVVNVAAHYSLKKIDMVESLKTVE